MKNYIILVFAQKLKDVRHLMLIKIETGEFIEIWRWYSSTKLKHELFRRNFCNINIFTCDEPYERAKLIVSHAKKLEHKPDVHRRQYLRTFAWLVLCTVSWSLINQAL